MTTEVHAECPKKCRFLNCNVEHSYLPEQANWEAYIAEEVQELPHGHLVPYPIAVEPEGFVTTLPGHRTFPDTKGSILGATMKVIRRPKPDHAIIVWMERSSCVESFCRC